MSGTLKIGGKTLATHDTSSNQINLHSDILATTTQVQGVLKSFSGAHSDGATTLTLNTVTDLSVGDYVAGEGIAVGVTVSSINSGNNTIVISTGLDLDGGSIAGGESITFYNATKALSAGTVAGGLCRAWARIESNGTITGSYNVSSVSASSGSYTVNFSTDMLDTNYSVCLSLGNQQAGNYIHYLHTANTSNVLIKVQYDGGNFGVFPRSFSIAIFR